MQVELKQLLPLLALADQYDVGLLHRVCAQAFKHQSTNHRCEDLCPAEYCPPPVPNPDTYPPFKKNKGVRRKVLVRV